MTTKTSSRPTLNPIAEYFGLQRMPFGRNLPVADLLELPGQGEMNARLHQAVREQGIALVTVLGVLFVVMALLLTMLAVVLRDAKPARKE